MKMHTVIRLIFLGIPEELELDLLNRDVLFALERFNFRNCIGLRFAWHHFVVAAAAAAATAACFS